VGHRRGRAGGERTQSITHEGMLALRDARVGSLPRGYRAQSEIATHGLQFRLDLRLLIVARHLEALGGALVPATGLDIVLGDIEVHAICVNTGNGALGDVVLVWEDQPLLEPEILHRAMPPLTLPSFSPDTS